MLAMHRGLIELPPPKSPGPPGAGAPDTEVPRPPPTALEAVRQMHPRRPLGEALERVLDHYLGYTTLVNALRRARPRRHAVGHARLLHRRLEAGSARQVHRLVAADAREQPAARRRQPALPDPALEPQPRILAIAAASCRWTGDYNTTPVLIETFAALHRRRRASGWTHVGATQGRGRSTRRNSTTRKRTSGCGPCRTGSSSTANPGSSRDQRTLSYIPFRGEAPRRDIGLCWRASSPRGALFNALAECVTQALD